MIQYISHRAIRPISTFIRYYGHLATSQSDDQSPLVFYGDIVPVIGLEIHAQLNIKSKLFSQGGTSSTAKSNSQLDLLDIALPGSLPKLNKNAIDAAILTALGLNCSIQDEISFDRKNYFYTDMPSGYQITQYNNPIAKNGFIDFIVTTHHKSVIAHAQHYDIVKYVHEDDRKNMEGFKPYIKRSQIKQLQMEQDSAKTLHHTIDGTQEEMNSLIDYNRCGSGLLEIVFEPDLTNHHEASSLVKELIMLLKQLDTCDCELQEGSLRVDANVSIKSISGVEIVSSKRVELKNLNSLKALNHGIHQEILRQAALLKEGKEIVQESRAFDTRTGLTTPLRLKETVIDYRYVPEPSIPPLRISAGMVRNSIERLPKELPCNQRETLLKDYGLDTILVSELVERPGLADYFREVIDGRKSCDANVVADFLIYTFANLKSIKEIDFSQNMRERLSPERMQKILDMIEQEEINFATAYEVAKCMYTGFHKSEPKQLVEKLGWYQIHDDREIEEACTELIAGMKNVTKKYAKKGEKRHMRLMLDKICELTKNRISVRKAMKCLDDKLRPKL